MSIAFDNSTVLILLVHLMVSVRLLGLFIASGVFTVPSLPLPIRFWLSVAIAVAVTGSLNLSIPVALYSSPLFILSMVAREFIIGGALGFFAGLPLYALQMSGFFDGTLMGFNMMNMFDPLSETQSSVMAQLKYVLAIWFYFHWNGHFLLLQGLVESFKLIPLSHGEWGVPISGLPWGIWLQRAIVMALRLSLPLLGAMLLAEIGLGFVARTVPQMNVFVLGIPLKIGVGLLLLVAVLPLTADVFHAEIEKSLEFALEGAFLWR